MKDWHDKTTVVDSTKKVKWVISCVTTFEVVWIFPGISAHDLRQGKKTGFKGAGGFVQIQNSSATEIVVTGHVETDTAVGSHGDAAVGEPEDAYVEEAIIITNFIMNNCIRHVITTDMLADQIQLTMVCRYSGLFPDISLCRGLALEILEYLYEEE